MPSHPERDQSLNFILELAVEEQISPFIFQDQPGWNADEKELNTKKRRGRPRKARNIQGKKLFEEQSSSEEDSISTSDHNDQEDEDEEQQPLIHTFRSSASKLRSMRVPQPETNGQAGTSRTIGSNG